MTRGRTPQLERRISAVLAAAGIAHRFENGKKHRKLYVEEKMVMVFSHGACAHKDIDSLPIQKALAAC